LKKNNYWYIWCCDNHENTGEGQLSNIYLNYLSKIKPKSEIIVSTYKKIFYLKDRKKLSNINKNNFNFFYKYFLPIIGIYKLWLEFIKKKKIFYLNYLPLWNSVIFIFSPPGTIFGPITGGLYRGKVNSISSFLRKYLFPILYFINLKILYYRSDFLIFSTSLLKKIIPNYIKKKCLFDFQALYLFNKKKLKNIKYNNVVFYYREHSNKNYNIDITKIKKNIPGQILAYGNFYDSKFVINHGLINKKKEKRLLLKSKYAIIASENYSSFFILDCYLNNIYLICNKFFYPKNEILFFKFLKKKSLKIIKILINENNLIKANNKILKILNKI